MTSEEKILILGSLFHDIGKFQQRCEQIRKPHQVLGKEFLDDFKDEFVSILNNSEDDYNTLAEIVLDHHKPNSSNDLVNLCRFADHLSASERVEKAEAEDIGEQWSHHFLSSVFSKINLLSKEKINPRYYRHELLTKKNYKILIPEYLSSKDAVESRAHYKNQGNVFENFRSDLKSVLGFYKDENDFESLINLILILFEKYMWCIPDFTGSPETDISLFNHLKDITGLSHALYKSNNNEAHSELNLIIGDIPGIQNYIFDVVNKKPAKILRGRSIFVQILSRNFASIFLKHLQLTEANLIMLAGGKFYIISQSGESFNTAYTKAKNEIENFLIKNFNYELRFSCSHHSFSANDLLEGKLKFGEIIDKASYNLLIERNQMFKENLLPENNFDESRFVLNTNYAISSEGDSNNIKCAVTDKPINNGFEEIIQIDSNKTIKVSRQVKNEFLVGSEITKNNLILSFSNDLSEIKDIKHISNYKDKPDSRKIILNPTLEELLTPENLHKDIFRNALFIETANYTSKTTDDDGKSHVMEFNTMSKKNEGAQFLTLVKGDIDNLGLIMSTGLTSDDKDRTSISRTTTMSNHLKYFFSFFMNGFLEDWDSVANTNNPQDQLVYTIFAGGDDLMFITPQTSSLRILKEFNSAFSDFTSNNPEIHISYSLTNFKDHTPIRLVAEMAEENQSMIKAEYNIINEFKNSTVNEKLFYPEYNKASVRLFNTNLKLSLLEDVMSERANMISWLNDDNNKVSKGVIRNLLQLTEIMNEFNLTGDTKHLLWHPKLNYMINRLLKNKDGKYYNTEVAEFFDNALRINKKNNPESQKLEKILYPALCETIYATRNSIGE